MRYAMLFFAEETHSFLPTWALLPMQNLDISNSDGSVGFQCDIRF